MSSSENTTSSDDLSYNSETSRSRSPIKRKSNEETMATIVASFTKQLEAKDEEIRELKQQIANITSTLDAERREAAEERRRNEVRHSELRKYMVRGAGIQPTESTEPVAKPISQLAEEMEVSPTTEPNTLKRTAPDEASSSGDEAPRQTKGKRKATAEERLSFAQAASNSPPAETTKGTVETEASTSGTATPKIPPVVLHRRETWSLVSRQLDAKKINYTKARLTSEGIQIQPGTANDYRNLTRLLVEGKHPHHTYSLPEERQLRVIIRGIPDGIANDEIKRDLENQGFTVHSVERLTCRRTKRSMPLALVKLPQDQEKVLEVTRCCALVVRAERQRAPQQATQCFRCQRFGHAQSKCTGEAKCVKCGLGHRSDECHKKRDQPAKCANCQGAHPANYRGCPSCPKQRGANKGKATPRQEPAKRIPTSPAAVSTNPPQIPKDGASFVEVTRRGKRVTPRAPPASAPRKEPVTIGDAEVALAKMMKMFAAMNALMQQFANLG